MRTRLHHRRPGTVLVYFALLSFVLMALAALVIDVGFAMFTQAQLQSAADSAAKEGLRFKDVSMSEDNRRNMVVTMVQLAFDDDLDPTNNSGTHPTPGAGLSANVSGGISVQGQL